MKRLLALSLILLSPALVLAQTAGETAKKPATKTAAKAPAKKTETSSRTQLKSAANQVATGIIAAEAALSPEELAIAERGIPVTLADGTLVWRVRVPGAFEIPLVAPSARPVWSIRCGHLSRRCHSGRHAPF